jgi:Ser/Thr protein kinase RdoA (MazF antagonist)
VTDVEADRATAARVLAVGAPGSTLERRLDGGHQGGAWLVRDADGTLGVLKTTPHEPLLARRPETTALVHALVAHGYPTPRWLRTGTTPDGVGYILSEYVDGRTPTWDDMTDELLDGLLAAVELQADIARPGSTTWSEYALSVVDADSPTLRLVAELGPSGAQLAALAAESRPGVDLPRGDAVHGDLGIGNTILAGGRLHVIDVDACGPGSRALDLAWLHHDAVRHGADARHVDRIRAAGESVAGAGVHRFFVAVAGVEFAAFTVRSGGDEAAADAEHEAAIALRAIARVSAGRARERSETS